MPRLSIRLGAVRSGVYDLGRRIAKPPFEMVRGRGYRRVHIPGAPGHSEMDPGQRPHLPGYGATGLNCVARHRSAGWRFIEFDALIILSVYLEGVWFLYAQRG
jgi:hypothetical protein